VLRMNLRSIGGWLPKGPVPAPWAPVFVLLVLGLAATARPAAAAGRIDREGVYNLGAWFQYGLIEGENRYGLDFSDGAGYSIHFRYHMSRKTAFVAYFDNQSYDARGDSLVDMTMTAAHIGVRFFGVPPGGDVLRYFEVTAGFYRPEIKLPNTLANTTGEDICFPGENFMIHAGAGAEIFLAQQWAIEFGLHGYGMNGQGLCPREVENGEGNFSVSGQIVLGLDYFLLR
jgi:hypothetical protein